MLKLFDLGARPARPPDASPAVRATNPTAPAAPEPVSPTALVLDAWSLRRGRDLVAESDRLRATGADALAAADYFGAAFDPDPRLAPGCADPRRHAFLARVLETPEYRALRADTRLDDTAAAIAAAHLAEQFARLPAPDAGDAAAKSDGGDFGAELAALRAAAAAADGARAEVGELRDAAAALGLGPGAPGAGDPAAVAALFKRVRNDPGLKRVCELAGRFRRVARAKQRRKTAHGTNDVVGVVPGGDVGRLLPAELVRLAVPELELDALRRVAEGHALCRAHHATEPVGKGPVLCVVDESGSMSGDKVHTAKALALALAWVARHQRRWAGLIAYSGGSGERLLALPPGRWDEGRLCDWLAAFLGRGSDLDVPVAELPRMYREIGAPAGVTDLVVVTDALCRIPAGVRDTFLAWRRAARVRATALVVGGAAPGDLAAVCDETHAVPALDPVSETVGRVLSL
jgi:uncharacterized protein with von Willebrand factor type A (vWA) domain